MGSFADVRRIEQVAAAAPRLILMCGLPGAGKTTVARRLAESLPAVRLCPDEWIDALAVDLYDEPFRERLERLHWAHAQELLRLGQSVIIENGLWSRSERDQMRLGARALDVPVELWFLDVPFEERWRRIEVRNGSGALGVVPMSRELFSSYEPFFQAPDAAELALFDTPACAE
jgi:predicted kinase